MLDTLCLTGFLIVSAVVMVICLVRQRLLLRGALFSAASGVASLWIVSLLSGTFHLGVTLNFFSVAASMIYGLPGVIGMLALQLITG